MCICRCPEDFLSGFIPRINTKTPKPDVRACRHAGKRERKGKE